MKVVNSKSLFALMFVNGIIFAAMPQNMSIVILNNSRKPMTIATGEYGTGKNAENLKLQPGGKSKSLVFTGDYRIFAAIETGNHYEIKYNPATVMIDITNLKTREKVQEIPATANLKYVATLD